MFVLCRVCLLLDPRRERWDLAAYLYTWADRRLHEGGYNERKLGKSFSKKDLQTILLIRNRNHAFLHNTFGTRTR
jgi:hypothetical protein